jgi:rhodanese-related sulfurtransferase
MSIIQNLLPAPAWKLYQDTPDAVLLDVRDPLEFLLVGHPPGALNIPWKYAPDWKPNPEFLQQVSAVAPHLSTPLFLLCRSGQRSMDAARLLNQQGYENLTNIEEGFEGPLDTNKRRNTLGGWRFYHLPWEQT